MPSLDGYSLNEEIKKLRTEVFEELSSLRESFRELYGYIADEERGKTKKPEPKKVSKPKKVKELVEGV